MRSPISASVILDTLRELNESVSVPTWLVGGVAVDFLVGKWTRPHGDIDLSTFGEWRVTLSEELERIGYRTSDTGWLTHWWQERSGRGVEIVFLDRTADGSAELNIPSDASVGIPGRYPLWPGYLDVKRFGTLDGVTFRVSSPAGEWLARTTNVVAGRIREAKIDHDLALLEKLIPAEELTQLRFHAADKKANQPPEPTAMSVTPPAAQEPRQP